MGAARDMTAGGTTAKDEQLFVSLYNMLPLQTGRIILVIHPLCNGVRLKMKFGKYMQVCIVVAAASFTSACSTLVEPIKLNSPSNQADIRADMSRLLAVNHIASASIATIKKGKLDWVGAYGQRGQNTPATTDTLYNIASLTKPLTAEVVLRLAAKGKLSLDEPMESYWSDPDLKDDPRRKRLTPRMALSHQTGFPNWRNPETGLAFDRDP